MLGNSFTFIDKNSLDDFGIKVVANGVESEKQFKFLAELGCIGFQGSYFSKNDLQRMGTGE